MLQGSRATIQSRVQKGHFAFELLDYEWQAGAEILEVHSDYFLLLWRLRPYQLEIPGRIGDSHVGSFGQLMLLPPAVPLKSEGPAPGAGRCQVVACRYDPFWLRDTIGFQKATLQDDVCLSLNNKDIDRAMRRLWHELVSPGLGMEVMSESLATGIAVDLARHLAAPSALSSQPKRSGLDLDKLRALVSNSEGTPATVAAIAREFGMSETHLRRMFKSATGRTIHAYVDRLRLERAKSMLCDAHISLKVISYRLGFSYPSAFSSAFRRATGQSPKDFRREHLATSRTRGR